MSVSTLLRSFAGGEITPEMYGRLDLSKFQTGLALAENFEVLPHGPARNRSGFAYVLEVKNSARYTRIIPFSYSATQTMVIELGHLYARFHTLEATLLEASKSISAITQANPGVFTSSSHGFSNGQTVYLASLGGMTVLNGRFCLVAGATTNTFTLTGLDGAAVNTASLPAYTGGGTVSRVYEVTTPYVEADLFDLHYVQSADVLTITHPNYAVRELRRLGATNWQLSSVSFVPTIATPGTPTVAAGAGSGAVTYSYKCTALSADGFEESLPSAAGSVTNNLATAGNYNNITPAAVAGAIRYNVYKLLNGLYGYIGQTDGSVFKDDNISADVSRTPPNSNNPFSTDYPAAVTYYEQRRWFAGTTLKPQNLWGTRSATESNLSYSIPTRDDDQIAFRMASRDNNAIRHLVPMSNLIALTAGGEWKIIAQNSDVLTPDSAAPKQFSAEGASNVQPVITGKNLIYAQAQGGRVREIRLNQYDGTVYDNNDISILAPHLFDGYAIYDMAYVKAPYKQVYFARSDGVMLGLTYLPEQEVFAWHHHVTDGFIESVAAVQEGTETALYAVIQRTINGRTVRYVERQRTRQLSSLEDAFFVDAGKTYSGAPATTISGLQHLEGAEVAILADGAVQPNQTVTNGTITLANAAAKVHIGLPYVADLQTLPMTLEGAPAGGQGRKKAVNQVFLRVFQSSGIFAGQRFDKLREYKQRTTEPYGSPPALRTGLAGITVDGIWEDDAQLCVRQAQPLPITVLSMTLDLAVGG